MALSDQLEALLGGLLEGEGIEILIRRNTPERSKSRGGDRVKPGSRALSATNVVASEPSAVDDQENGALSGSKKSSALRPMLSIKQVLAKVPFSRSSIYRGMEEGHFPKGHLIGPRRIAWFEDEVEAWQKALDNGRKPGG